MHRLRRKHETTCRPYNYGSQAGRGKLANVSPPRRRWRLGAERPAAEQDAGAAEVSEVFLAFAGGAVGVYTDRARESDVEQSVGFADPDPGGHAGEAVSPDDRGMGCRGGGDV